MILLISYDLRNPEKDYSSFYNEIKNAGTWWHHLESTWLIRTNDDVEMLYSKLAKHIFKNDGLLIIEIQDNYSGWLPGDAWNWIRNQFENDRDSPFF